VLIYLDQNNDDKNKNIFMGPSKFGISNANYINIDKFNDFELVRDDSHVYKFNDIYIYVISNANYINIDKFNDFELVRDDSHVYKFNDMTFSAETFYDFISDKYVFDKEKQCQ
jgi:CMP-N-acetylneuraminic acid synthetase